MAQKTPIGILYPIKRGSTGYFEQSFDTKQSVKDSLANLILTPKKTRPGRPEYGCSIYGFLFEQSDFLKENIKSILQEDLNIWAPYIELVDVKITVPENLENSLNLNLQYKIKGTPTEDSLDILLTA